TGNWNPSHVYAHAGDYQAVVRVTDTHGDIGDATSTVTVHSVAPTATVTASGPTPEGSAVVFTVAGLTEADPDDPPSVWVDWTGDGSFDLVPADDWTAQGDGPFTFNHVYDD